MMGTATLLLPASGRLEGVALPPALARALARADRLAQAPGGAAQLSRHAVLEPAPASWPVAALTRQLDAGDAGSARWLRADPCHVAADMQGVRLLAHGPALALEPAEAEAFAAELAPVFAAHGLAFSAPEPSRWYLRLPGELEPPPLVDVDEVLGDDLFDHLPAGGAGRLWRALLSDTQVLLHQHPANARRQAAGKASVNSLWFWGTGMLPATVRFPHAGLRSPDPLLQALDALAPADGRRGELVDLRHLRDARRLVDQALLPLVEALDKGELETLTLDFADGLGFVLRPRQRWRIWRRPLASLQP